MADLAQPPSQVPRVVLSTGHTPGGTFPTMALSTLRRAQHDAVKTLTLTGTVLDVGGNPKSAHHKLIAGDHKVVFGNINPQYEPDLLFDAQDSWPVDAESFDAVLMFNLLEHVFDHQAAVDGAYRALKPGGRLIVSVPFLFYVHGSPSDYFRYTRHALSTIMESSGFTEVKIQELGTGAVSVAFQAIEGPFGPLTRMGQRIARLLDRLLARIKPGNKLGLSQFPVGYHVEATKPVAAG